MKNYVKFVLKNYIFKMFFIDIITPDISSTLYNMHFNKFYIVYRKTTFFCKEFFL